MSKVCSKSITVSKDPPRAQRIAYVDSRRPVDVPNCGALGDALSLKRVSVRVFGGSECD
jgi:hypothetical protein